MERKGELNASPGFQTINNNYIDLCKEKMFCLRQKIDFLNIP